MLIMSHKRLIKQGFMKNGTPPKDIKQDNLEELEI